MAMTRKQWIILACLGALCLGLVSGMVYLALYWNASARGESNAPPAAGSTPLAELPASLPGPTSTPSIQPVSPSPSPPPFTTPTPADVFSPAQGALPEPSCVLTETWGLGSEIYAIVQAMPGTGSNGMQVPTAAQIAAWELLVQMVMQGNIPAACQIIHIQGFPYHLVHYTDVVNENERYWMLREDASVSLGWGTYVFRTPEDRQISLEDLPLVIEVPHPVADWRTDPQGVKIFRQSPARALLVAGTNRCANRAFSTCAGQTWACGQLEAYRTSDVAHTDQSMFMATHRALVPCDGTAIALQLHANSLANCPDLFISNGTLFPGVRSRALYQAALSTCSEFSVDIADGMGLDGVSECAFTGGASAQAVYSNLCADDPSVNACADPPTRPPQVEQYISLEQSSRLTPDYQCLVEAIRETWIPDRP
jgi:hypothetical protein